MRASPFVGIQVTLPWSKVLLRESPAEPGPVLFVDLRARPLWWPSAGEGKASFVPDTKKCRPGVEAEREREREREREEGEGRREWLFRAHGRSLCGVLERGDLPAAFSPTEERLESRRHSWQVGGTASSLDGRVRARECSSRCSPRTPLGPRKAALSRSSAPPGRSAPMTLSRSSSSRGPRRIPARSRSEPRSRSRS